MLWSLTDATCVKSHTLEDLEYELFDVSTYGGMLLFRIRKDVGRTNHFLDDILSR